MKKFMGGLLLLLIIGSALFVLAPALLSVAILVGAIFLKIYSPKLTGMLGEGQVKRALESLGDEYSTFHDMYVPDEKGGLTQVDHVVTSPYGIFVIETKNYQGWIFGQEDKKYWMQVIYKRKEKLFNPIWQNTGHCKALRNYMKNDSIPLHSIIAFSKRATLKMDTNFRAARVIYIPEVIQIIGEYKIRTISESELGRVNESFQSLLNVEKDKLKRIKKEHVSQVKMKQQAHSLGKPKLDGALICPSCGNSLTQRKGKYGDFYGCSGYPKCRHTQKVL